MSDPKQTAPGPEQAPLPPLEVALRSGSSPGPEDNPYENWLGTGRACREEIDRLLGPDWSWEGKRVLDFGCGAGRTLRHFLPEAARAEFHGCDIFAQGVAWIERELSPPLTVFASSEAPPLDRPDGDYDLIYALSVFTHLTVRNQRLWLRELRRLLRPSAPLVLTLHGDALVDALEPAQRSAYRNGEIVVTWREAEGTNLCGAYHPAGSLEAIATGFRVVEHLPSGAAGNAPQDLYVLERL